jgi:hypothetical protein
MKYQKPVQGTAPRHNLDLNIKYSFVPQTDPPYELDKSVPEIDFSEPHKVILLFMSGNSFSHIKFSCLVTLQTPTR